MIFNSKAKAPRSLLLGNCGCFSSFSCGFGACRPISHRSVTRIAIILARLRAMYCILGILAKVFVWKKGNSHDQVLETHQWSSEISWGQNDAGLQINWKQKTFPRGMYKDIFDVTVTWLSKSYPQKKNTLHHELKHAEIQIAIILYIQYWTYINFKTQPRLPILRRPLPPRWWQKEHEWLNDQRKLASRSQRNVRPHVEYKFACPAQNIKHLYSLILCIRLYTYIITGSCHLYVGDRRCVCVCVCVCVFAWPDNFKWCWDLLGAGGGYFLNSWFSGLCASLKNPSQRWQALTGND